MRRALPPALVLIAGTGIAAAVSWLAYGRSHALPTAVFFAACGAPVLVCSHLLAAGRRRLGSLSRQFAAGIALVGGFVLAGVGAISLLMFVSPHDAYLLAVLLAFAGGLATYAARLLARGVQRDIEQVRDRLVAVGEGDRTPAPVRTGGHDEIAELAAAADLMTRQLAEREAQRDTAERARRDLIAAVSHDLRTPLTSLQLLAQGLEDGVLGQNGDRRTSLEAIGVHVRSMSTLVDDLFELTRLEAGDIHWSMRRVHLEELLAETVAAMRTHAAAKGVAVEARVPPDLAPAEANPEKLQRVLFNLIQNAIHHTPPDGSVTVRAESNGSAVEIEVADTGSGIPAAERERVFEPFYRAGADESRTREGSGLGLSICRAIVEVHGGRIWLADSGPGTSVRFTLPRAG